MNKINKFKSEQKNRFKAMKTKNKKNKKAHQKMMQNYKDRYEWFNTMTDDKGVFEHIIFPVNERSMYHLYASDSDKKKSYKKIKKNKKRKKNNN